MVRNSLAVAVGSSDKPAVGSRFLARQKGGYLLTVGILDETGKMISPPKNDSVVKAAPASADTKFALVVE